MQIEQGSNKGRRRDVGGMIAAAAFILLGAAALWDTTRMMDADSYVFPRTVAIAMIVFSLTLIVWNLVLPGAGEARPEAPGASTTRRVALVAAMLISAALMPVTGFFIAGLGAFFCIMLIAMYDPWTRFRLVVYPVVAVAVVLGFHLLFSKLLQVPLPAGSLFD